MNSKRIAATLVVALASAVANAQNAGPQPGPMTVSQAVPVAPLSLAVALKMAQASMTACNALGLAPTVTYVDREGTARVVLVSDGAGPVSISTSRRKAYTAAAIGLPTEEFAKIIAELKVDPANVDKDLIQFKGGVPIFKKGVLVGGIGVGGAEGPTYPGSGDTRCVLAGLAAIKADLE